MLDAAIRRLESSGESIAAIARGLGPDERLWKPDETAWSVHEVVCHLRDEERDDFRRRLRLTLEDPAQVWPPIDPQGWVRSRDYASWNYDETLGSWERERADSLVWLRSLSAPELELSHDHPLGPIRAGDLLASWVAHDLLHLRQILRLRFLSWNAGIGNYVTLYAGEW